MYKIFKITSNPVVDFAAEELKKYLRMMMPRCGEITIEYKPDARDGFRLGLMSDFGLDTSEAPDVELDDILHIDTDERGGIISGDNPRSILLAVYRYLTINGCRWLYPGIDGEYIPIKSIEPVKYHKMADCRYRGQCNEGSEYQPNMIEAIDFTPKIGMNIFMIEFDNPKAYYERYYLHRYNRKHRELEPVTDETLLQWKRQCEAEISKRGLQFHDMGHGWTASAIGIKSDGNWEIDDSVTVPEESVKFLAEINGKRELFGGVPINTNLCMSNPEVRRRMVNDIANYAELQTNVDYLHVWLADASNNHCECESCVKKTPSDWYVIIMNELDSELTRRGLDTRIVFCIYVDTTFAPETETLNNPERFSLLLGAITRSYTKSVPQTPTDLPLEKYECNNNKFPESVDGYVSYAREWNRRVKAPVFAYEYHFWLHQYYAPGTLGFSKIVHDDVKGYRANGIQGIIQDGSQRSFFPTGFPFYVYSETLFDCSADFENMKEDYFSHAYGEDWKEVESFLKKIDDSIPAKYLEGEMSVDRKIGKFYNPEMADSLKSVKDIIKEFEPFVEAHKNMPKRAQTVSYRILKRFMQFCDGLAHYLTLLCLGANEEAKTGFFEFFTEFGKYELEIERYYDQGLMGSAISGRVFMARSNTSVVFIT